ncbi:MAG TPA: aldolase/citrate lyase family protein [Kiritimatiellia bacterium]|nr:aldolase/citrate lyase family protein [Kiritimatiellia bacterium]
MNTEFSKSIRLLLVSATVACSIFAQNAPGQKPRLNRFIELMEANQPAFGLFSSIVSTRNGSAMAGSGLDFVIVDLEHTPYDLTRLEGYLLGMINKAEILKKGNLQPSVVPFVRVPAAGREQLQFIIKQVLDLGPFGLVVPHVDTAADARAMVQASRFPQVQGVADFEPAGKRGVGYGWAARYWGLSGADYGERADLWPLDPQGELVLWLMIETRESVDNVLEIARTPGVGGLFVGPSDLALSLGVPFDDAAVETAIEKVLAAGRQAKVPVGTLCPPNQVERRLAQGFLFLAVGGDGGVSGSVTEAVRRGRAFRSK